MGGENSFGKSSLERGDSYGLVKDGFKWLMVVDYSKRASIEISQRQSIKFLSPSKRSFSRTTRVRGRHRQLDTICHHLLFHGSAQEGSESHFELHQVLAGLAGLSRKILGMVGM